MTHPTRGSTTNISGLPGAQPYDQIWRGARDVSVLTILYHPDLQRIGERAVLSGLEVGRELRLSRKEPLFTAVGGGSPRGLQDEALSRKPILLSRTAKDGYVLDPTKSRTLLAVSGKVVKRRTTWEEPPPHDGLILELSGRIVLFLHRAQAETEDAYGDLGMVGRSDSLNRVRAQISQVADLDIPVLLRGESGTGKELAARAIHRLSSRKAHLLVSVNMGGLQPELAAAELFGSEKGAYTGAVKGRKGYFREAHGGTLFLDEIGEAPPNVQTLLLRVLETQEVLPVGSSTAVPVDVRIIAATDADLEAMVDKGDFRSPVIHRLSSFEIDLPPLRERREDLGCLLRHMLTRELKQINELGRLDPNIGEPWFPAPLVALLARYSWPGNVRQLGNVVRQLVITNRGRQRFVIDPKIASMLKADLGSASKKKAGSPPGTPVEINDQLLVDTLKSRRWELTPTAKALGISRPTLYKLIRAHPRLRLAEDIGMEEIEASFQQSAGDLSAMVEQLQISAHALRRRLRDMGMTPEREGGDL